MRNEGTGKLRLLYIYKLLLESTDENHMLSTEQIRIALKEFWNMDAHRNTVSDDIQLLQMAGVEIGKYESTQNKYWMISRPLEQAELKILIDAVASSKVITKKKSRDLMDRLSSLGSPFKREELIRNICPEDRVKGKNETSIYNVDIINEAINQKHKIAFRYFSYDANKHKSLKNGGDAYIFSPYSLVWNGDYYYMVGWSDKHNGIGSFRVDRIDRTADILTIPAEPIPRGFRVSKYIKENYHMFSGPVQAVDLFCDGDVMDSIIDRFGYDVRTELQGDGRFIAHISIGISSVFYGWVFGFGGKVKIAGPTDVAEGYREMVRKAL